MEIQLKLVGLILVTEEERHKMLIRRDGMVTKF